MASKYKTCNTESDETAVEKDKKWVGPGFLLDLGRQLTQGYQRHL
jgi:hypothetical protein